jgi:hypothetical protein
MKLEKFWLLLAFAAVPCGAAPAKHRGRLTPEQVQEQTRLFNEASSIAFRRFQTDYKIDIYRSKSQRFYSIQDDEPKYRRITILPIFTRPESGPRIDQRRGRLGYGFGVAYFVSKKDMKIHKLMRSGTPSTRGASRQKIVTEWQ